MLRIIILYNSLLLAAAETDSSINVWVWREEENQRNVFIHKTISTVILTSVSQNVGPRFSEVKIVEKCQEGFPPSFSLLICSGFYLFLVQRSGNLTFL